jgi:hypothetical protein
MLGEIDQLIEGAKEGLHPRSLVRLCVVEVGECVERQLPQAGDAVGQPSAFGSADFRPSRYGDPVPLTTTCETEGYGARPLVDRPSSTFR